MTKEEAQNMINKALGDLLGGVVGPDAIQRQVEASVKEWLAGTFKQANPAKQAMNDGNVGAYFVAFAAGKGDKSAMGEWAKKHLGEQHPVTKAVMATVATQGAELVPEVFSGDVIELLRPASAFYRANPTRLNLTNGNITIPGIAGGSTFAWIGEAKPVPVGQLTFRRVKLSAKKGGGLVVVSNDFIRYGIGGAAQMIQQDLVAELKQGVDSALFRADGTEYTPKGLKNWAAPANVFDSVNPYDLDTITRDIAKAILKLRKAYCRMLRPVIFLGPSAEMTMMTVRDGLGAFAFRDEMSRGTILGIPYIRFDQMPETLGVGGDESEIIVADMADVIVGEGLAINLEILKEASYTDPVTSAVRNLALEDCVGIRALVELDVAVRHAESVAVIQKVKWNFA